MTDLQFFMSLLGPQVLLPTLAEVALEILALALIFVLPAAFCYAFYKVVAIKKGKREAERQRREDAEAQRRHRAYFLDMVRQIESVG